MNKTETNTFIKPRVQSIDLVRGIVMIIMALDHTRDFTHSYSLAGNSPTDLSITSMPIFLTRWITHFCAPLFILLSGTSIFFIHERKTTKQVSFFLLTRGLWLIFLEMTIIQYAWAGDFSYQFTSFGVISVIGLCMVLLSALIFLPKKLLLFLGLLLIFGHNALDKFDKVTNDLSGFIWSVLHVPHAFTLDANHTFEVLYCVLPWLGVMVSGYVFGSLYKKDIDPIRRKKALILLGFGCIFLFILLRSGNFYGDYEHWQKQPTATFTFLSFINTSKYPPSLLFLLMTLGQGMIFIAIAEKLRGKIFNMITIFGRVPLFYYVLHLLLIHAIAWMVFAVQGHSMYHIDIRDADIPAGAGVSLSMVYLIWIFVIFILYFPCNWYNRYKSSHTHWWLSYI